MSAVAPTVQGQQTLTGHLLGKMSLSLSYLPVNLHERQSSFISCFKTFCSFSGRDRLTRATLGFCTSPVSRAIVDCPTDLAHGNRTIQCPSGKVTMVVRFRATGKVGIR